MRRAFARGITLMPGNNLGYFGTEEAPLRSPHDVSVDGAPRDHWQGCQAGRMVMGSESDGGVQGCPSLRSSHDVGDTLKDRSLRPVEDDAGARLQPRPRRRPPVGLLQDVCVWLRLQGRLHVHGHALFGRPGNNPYCHFRACTLAAQGLRERLVPGEAGPGLPYDNGLFDVVVEPRAAAEPWSPAAVGDGRALVAIGRTPKAKAALTTAGSAPVGGVAELDGRRRRRAGC